VSISRRDQSVSGHVIDFMGCSRSGAGCMAWAFTLYNFGDLFVFDTAKERIMEWLRCNSGILGYHPATYAIQEWRIVHVGTFVDRGDVVTIWNVVVLPAKFTLH